MSCVRSGSNAKRHIVSRIGARNAPGTLSRIAKHSHLQEFKTQHNRSISSQTHTRPRPHPSQSKTTTPASSSIHTPVSATTATEEPNSSKSQEQHQTQEQITNIISSLPLIRYLRSQTQASPSQYTETRAYNTLNPSARPVHLVANSLLTPTKLPIDPYLFIKTPTPPSSSPGPYKPQIIAACYISHHLCGHPGYVHGGMSFLLFDDVFTRCASLALGGGAAMTANLSVDFRKPALPDRVYVYRAVVRETQGRKAWVEGQLRCLRVYSVGALRRREVADGDGVSTEEVEGEVVAEARALFVRPRFGESMAPLFVDE